MVLLLTMIVVNHCGVNNTIYRTCHNPVPYGSFPVPGDGDLVVDFLSEDIDFDLLRAHAREYVVGPHGTDRKMSPIPRHIHRSPSPTLSSSQTSCEGLSQSSSTSNASTKTGSWYTIPPSSTMSSTPSGSLPTALEDRETFLPWEQLEANTTGPSPSSHVGGYILGAIFAGPTQVNLGYGNSPYQTGIQSRVRTPSITLTTLPGSADNAITSTSTTPALVPESNLIPTASVPIWQWQMGPCHCLSRLPESASLSKTQPPLSINTDPWCPIPLLSQSTMASQQAVSAPPKFTGPQPLSRTRYPASK